jgi:hypothetical protein
MDVPIASCIPDAPARNQDASRCAGPERACVADLGELLA